MNRRKFILRSILLLMATGFLYVFWWWRFRLASKECRGVIVAILERRLNYLDMDSAGLRKFADDVHESLDPYVRERLSQCSLFLPVFGLFDSWAMSGQIRAAYLALSEPLISRYLLSTDFFHRGAASPNLLQTVHYSSGRVLASPVCGNPWADLSLPA
jgi:hypothetical protein